MAIHPAPWTMVKAPSVVFDVYLHPSCNTIKFAAGSKWRFSDALGSAVSNFGRVCGVGFQIVVNATDGNKGVGATPFRIQVLPWEKMEGGAAGYSYNGSPWIAICQTMWDGKTHYGPWDVRRLISIIQHEICHKPQFGSLGWSGGHAPSGYMGVGACMDPWSPLLARYPGTETGVDRYGLAGFNRREANYLATRYGLRWLHYVEPGLALSTDPQKITREKRRYPLSILGVHDGDTVKASVSLGLGLQLTDQIRLRGINAPELRGPDSSAGEAARVYLSDLLAEGLGGLELEIEIGDERDKYGRILGKLWAYGKDLGAEMVRAGHAIEYLV